MSYNHLQINRLHNVLSKSITAILLFCLYVLMCAGQTRAATNERHLAILPLDTSNSIGMAYLAPSIEAMLKSRLTRPGILKTMSAPDAKTRLAGITTSNIDEICNKLNVDYVLKGKITTEKSEPRIAIDIFAKGNAAPITSSILSPRNLDEIIPKITELSANIIESVITNASTKLATDEKKEERPTLLAVAPDDDKQSMLRINPAKLLNKNITNKEKDETLHALAKAGKGIASKEERPTVAGASSNAETAISSPTTVLAAIKSNEAERPVLVSNTPAPSSNILTNASAPKQETWWNKLMPWQKDKEKEQVVTVDADRSGLPYPTLNELMSRYKRPEPVQPVLQTAASGTSTKPSSSQTQANTVKQQSNTIQPAAASPAFQTTATSGSTSSIASAAQSNQSAEAQKTISTQTSQQAQGNKKGLLSWLSNPFNSKTETQTSPTQQTQEASNKKKIGTTGETEDGPIWQWY